MLLTMNGGWHAGIDAVILPLPLVHLAYLFVHIFN